MPLLVELVIGKRYEHISKPDTHFYETGDVRIFGEHTPNCAIFRFEKGRLDRNMSDGRRFTEVAGQLMFLRENHQIRFSDIFTVKVGAVSGADHIYAHPKGNMEFVCSKTIETSETRRVSLAWEPFGRNRSGCRYPRQS